MSTRPACSPHNACVTDLQQQLGGVAVAEFVGAMQGSAADVIHLIHLAATACEEVSMYPKGLERARTSTPPFKIGAKASLRPADAALAKVRLTPRRVARDTIRGGGRGGQGGGRWTCEHKHERRGVHMWSNVEPSASRV